MQCCLNAAKIMEATLKLGGWFVVKLLWGPEQQNWRTYLDSRFQKVRSIRPAASRQSRGEYFCVCRDFLGREHIAEEIRIRSDFFKHEGKHLWDYKGRAL